MRSTATRTSASSPSREFSTWGGSSYNGTEQPRFSIKDDLTISKGSHTIKTGFTFDRQQANGFGQQDIGGRAGFSFLETGVPGATTLANAGGNSFASFLLGAADTGRTETIRYLQQVYPYYGFYVQDDWRINDKLVLNYGLRYEFTQPPRAGGDQYSDFSPTKPNPAVNNYPGALVFAGDGPGREGTSSLFPGYYGALAPRVSFAYSANDKTIVRGGVGRSFGRVTVVAGQQSLCRVHRSVRVRVGRCRRDAGVQSGSGAAGLSAAAADRSDVLEQQRRGLVQRSGGQPAGAVRQLDDLGPARSPQGHDRGARLQRRLRIEPAGGVAQSQPGADVGGERPDCALRPDRRARPAELADHVCGGDRRRHHECRMRTSPTPRCSVRGRSPRRCGRIRSTSR